MGLLRMAGNVLKSIRLGLGIILITAVISGVGVVLGQAGVTAEAYKEANLRAGAGIDYVVVGKITAGTAYPVIGRSGRFPWLLLEIGPGQLGWVFQDLVKVQGDLNSVPVTDLIITPGAVNPPAETPTAQATLIEIAPLPSFTPSGDGTPALPPTLDLSTPPVVIASATPGGIIDLVSSPTPGGVIEAVTPTPTLTLPAPTIAAAVYAEPINSANLRYGPDPSYPRIGEIKKGEKYAVLRRHAQVPWYEIAYAGVASGRAWVFADLVILEGDINLVPLITEMNFGYPTLTPTPNKVVSGVSPFGSTPVSLSTPLEALGKNLYDYLMAQGFEPGTNTQGSLFLLNLKTGEAVSLNPGIAYSGVSLMKIPVLVSFFRKVNTIPDATQAQLMAEMIACSENISSNKLLATLGDGDEYRGTQYLTETMRTLGLKNTFLARSFYDGVVRAGATEQPFMPPTIEADQVQTNPDPSNQTTPEDMGWLLSGMYQCALNGDGPLVSAFPNQIDQNECRRMIRVLRTNHIGALIEAGVPSGVTVAHKHGWANAAYGDAGIVFTSGGDYVLSVMLGHTGKWLLQEITFPTIAEISRQTYNLFNPGAPLASTHTQPVPTVCTIDTINALDPNYLTDMQNPNPPAIR